MEIDDTVKHVPGTYLIIDDENKKVYVGSTGNLRERAMNHRSYLRNGKHPSKLLQEHYDNCDGDLKFVAVELENKEVALELEQSIINDFYGTGILCNKGKNADCPTKGLSFKHTDEQNRKKSEAQKGRKASDATRAKISAAAKKRGISDTTRQKCKEAHYKQIIVNGMLYPSIKEASIQLGIPYDNIQHRLYSANYPNFSFFES